MPLVLTTTYWLLEIIVYILFARLILSFFQKARDSRTYSFLISITEPVLEPVRRLLSKTPLAGTRLDFSFLAVIILVNILQALIRTMM
ncbi:MAG: YggT family protein [Clostridia bacterium]